MRLRYPAKPKPNRAVPKSGNAAGTGTTEVRSSVDSRKLLKTIASLAVNSGFICSLIPKLVSPFPIAALKIERISKLNVFPTTSGVELKLPTAPDVAI